MQYNITQYNKGGSDNKIEWQCNMSVTKYGKSEWDGLW